MLSAICFNLDKAKILSSRNELSVEVYFFFLQLSLISAVLLIEEMM